MYPLEAGGGGGEWCFLKLIWINLFLSFCLLSLDFTQISVLLRIGCDFGGRGTGVRAGVPWFK